MPEDTKLLLLVGFPAENHRPGKGKGVEMKISLGLSVDQKSILETHIRAKPFISDDKKIEEEVQKIFTSQDYFLHTADTLEGNSGTPVLVGMKKGYHICGIHTGGLQVHWNKLKSNTKVNYARILPSLSLFDSP